MVHPVEKETQRRGSWDTRPLGHVIAIVLSVLLHVLPFPVYLFGGMYDWFGEPLPELPDHETIIPIDLMLTEGSEEAPGGKEPAFPEPKIPTLEEPPTVLPPKAPEPADAGVVDAAAAAKDADVDAVVDSGAADASRDADIEKDAEPTDAADLTDAIRPDAATPTLDAAIAEANLDASTALDKPDATTASTDVGVTGPGDAAAPFRPIRDPVGLAGDAQKIAPKDPNVSLLLYPERIRAHPMGNRFGQTVTKLRNWRNFFQGTGLDPVRDADRILLAGPQLRDSSRVVAVLRYNVPQQQVRAAIDSMVKRSGDRGEWVPNKPVPVAKAFVDGAERYFVMSGPNMLVVVPPDGLAQALKLPRNLRFPNAGNEAVVLFLKYPANAFRDMPVRLPASVEWMRFSLSLDENGGGYARLDAKDKDAESAAKNAPDLTEVINKAVVFDFMFGKIRLLDPVTFRAEGDHIRTETRVTPEQIRHLYAIISARIEQVDKERTPAPPASK